MTMSTTQQLAAALVEKTFIATELYDTGGFVPFIAATDGLTAEQAAAVPSERVNSVWAIVNHISYLQTQMYKALLREEGEPPSMDAAWRPPGEITEGNWQAARQQALDSNRKLAEVIVALRDDQLEQNLPGWFGAPTDWAIFIIHGHLSYHTGEIVTVRHMQGLWVDHPFA